MTKTATSIPFIGIVALLILLLSPFFSCSAGGPVQLTIQIWKGSDLASVSKESESTTTINSGEAAPIAVDTLSDYVFFEWEVVSGGSVAIADASKPKTSVAITDNSTIKAVYLQAYVNPFNGHYYMAYNDLVTWTDARAACEKRGGYLATITSQDEQDFINIIVKMSGQSTFTHWCGGFQPLYSSEPTGNWQWVTGENFSFTYWLSPSQPDNAGGIENFIMLFSWSDYSAHWNDASNDYGGAKCGYICEWGWEDTYMQKKTYNGHTYAFVDIPMTWDQANDYCVKLGAHLATITSPGEQDFIFSILPTTVPKADNYWLGGSQAAGSSEPSGGWKWVTGENISSTNVFLNWDTILLPAQPDNNSGADKLILRASDGKWLDEVNNPSYINSCGILIEWEP